MYLNAHLLIQCLQNNVVKLLHCDEIIIIDGLLYLEHFVRLRRHFSFSVSTCWCFLLLWNFPPGDSASPREPNSFVPAVIVALPGGDFSPAAEFLFQRWQMLNRKWGKDWYLFRGNRRISWFRMLEKVAGIRERILWLPGRRVRPNRTRQNHIFELSTRSPRRLKNRAF